MTDAELLEQYRSGRYKSKRNDSSELSDAELLAQYRSGKGVTDPRLTEQLWEDYEQRQAQQNRTPEYYRNQKPLYPDGQLLPADQEAADNIKFMMRTNTGAVQEPVVKPTGNRVKLEQKQARELQQNQQVVAGNRQLFVGPAQQTIGAYDPQQSFDEFRNLPLNEQWDVLAKNYPVIGAPKQVVEAGTAAAGKGIFQLESGLAKVGELPFQVAGQMMGMEPNNNPQLSDFFQSGSERFDQLMQEQGELNPVSKAVYAVGPEVTKILVTGGIGRALAGGSELAQMAPFMLAAAGDYAKEAQSYGATPAQQAAYGTMMGYMEGLSEKLPFDYMLGSFGGKQGLIEFIRGLNAEGLEEVVMNPIQVLAQRGILGQGFDEDIIDPDRELQSYGQGVSLAGVLQGMGAGYSRMADSLRSQGVPEQEIIQPGAAQQNRPERYRVDKPLTVPQKAKTDQQAAFVPEEEQPVQPPEIRPQPAFQGGVGMLNAIAQPAANFNQNQGFRQEPSQEANPEPTVPEEIKPVVEQTKAVSEPTFKYISDFGKRVQSGDVTAQEVKEHHQFMIDNEDAIKQSIVDYMNSSEKYKRKRKDTKTKLAEDTFNRELERLAYAASDSFSSEVDFNDFKGARRRSIKNVVDSLTDEAIQQHREANQQYRVSIEKSLTNPETLDEFRRFVSVKGEAALTAEQRAKYDELIAGSMKEQKAKAEQRQATVKQVNTNVGMEMVETKHTKTGQQLFVVKMAERVDSDTYKELNSKAKQLGGYYSSFRGAGAIPGFQFKTKEAAERFMALREGDVSKADMVAERKEESKNKTAQKLSDLADRMTESANEELNRERKTNTAKRAGEAAYAEERARKELALAGTIRNIAQAIEGGKAKHLDGVTARTHVELLERLLYDARNQAVSNNDEKDSRRDPQASDINEVKYPYPEKVNKSIVSYFIEDLKANGAKMYAARLGKKLANATGEVVEFSGEKDLELIKGALAKAKELRIDVPWYLESTVSDYNRLQAMGLETLPQLRAALREYLQYKGKKAEADPVKKMEQELVGTKIAGYFPTPKPIVDQMIEQAGIEPGMSVLEPSAGKGNIADAIRAAGVEPDVIEIVPTLRNVLEAKKHKIVSNDFTEFTGEYDRIVMNPPFENGQDIDHVEHAYDLLKPGGKVVAIMSEGPFYRSDKKAAGFREWLDEVGGTSEKLPKGSFKNSDRSTGVNTRIVTIEKPGEAKKTDFAKIEAAVKEAGFKDVEEAALAFRAEQNGFQWFKNTNPEIQDPGKEFMRLQKQVRDLPETQMSKLKLDLQFFAQKSNQIPIEDRNYEMVAKRDVRAYQQLHPELADYIQGEAIRIIGEMADVVKGERFVTNSDLPGQGGEVVTTGQSKLSSETITRIQEATGATYAEIGEALEAIAKGTEKINTALAKKIELIIDYNLTNGVKDIRGEQLKPDQEYLWAKQNVKPVTDTELYDRKQVDKLKAKYEARIKNMRFKDKVKFLRSLTAVKKTAQEKLHAEKAKAETKLKVAKWEAGERLKKVKEAADQKVEAVKKSEAKKVQRIQYQELWKRLTQEKASKEEKQAELRKLRQFFKDKEAREKLARRERELDKRATAAERKLRNKLINNLKKVSSKLKRLRPEYQRPVKAILDDLNFRTPSKKKVFALTRLQQHLAAMENPKNKNFNPDLRIPPEKIAELKRLARKNIRQMTTDEIKTIHDTVLHYVHLNILKNKLIMNRKYVDFNELKGKLVSKVVELKRRRGLEKVELTTSRPGNDPNGVIKFIRKHLNTDNITRELDGQAGGEFHEVIYQGADEARDLEYKVHYSIHDFIQEGFKQAGITPKDIDGFSELFHTRGKNVDYVKLKLQSGETVTITKGDRIAIYLHSLNDNNRASMLYGGLIPDKNRTAKIKLTEKDLKTIIDSMTETEKKVADIFYQVYNDVSRKFLNERSLETDGFERATMENYYPKKVPAIERKIDALKMRDNPFGRFTVEGQGFLKERSHSKTGIILEDAFKTLFRHMEGLAAYYGRSKFARNAKMVLYDKDLRRQIESIDNGFTWKQLDSFVADIETGGARADDIDRVVGSLLTKIDTSILGLNAKVILKQFMSYPLMFNHINPKYLVSTVGQKVDPELIKKYSYQLRQRIEGAVSIETGELGKVGSVRRFFTGKETFGSKTTRGIEWADELQLVNAWNAVTAETKDKRPDLNPGSDEFYQVVAKRVEEIFRYSQSVFDPKDRSELGRNKGIGWRIVTRFTSQRNVIFNELYRTIMDYQQSEKTGKDYAKMAGRLFNVAVVGSALNYMIDALWKAIMRLGDDDKKKEKVFDPKDLAVGMVKDLSSYVYIFGEGVNMVTSMMERGSAYGVNFRAPLLDAATDFLKGLYDGGKAVQQGITQEVYQTGKNRGNLKWTKTAWRAAEQLTSTLGRFRGVPLGNVIRQSKPLWKLLYGNRTSEDQQYDISN